MLALNQFGRAPYASVPAEPRRLANIARFVFLNPDAAKTFFVDYGQITGFLDTAVLQDFP